MQPIPSPFVGSLLVAMPQLDDERFARSVIYLCAHTGDGAMGIMVNSPLRQPSFPDLLRQLNVDPVPPARVIRLCSGGPVEHSRGFVLHTTDWTADGSLRIDDRLALTASVDILRAIAEGGGPRQGVLALGYAGWGPGQLDAEVERNSWLSVPVTDLALIFDDDDAGRWQRALTQLKVGPSLLSGAVGHA